MSSGSGKGGGTLGFLGALSPTMGVSPDVISKPNAVNCVKGEIHNVLYVMRLNRRWASEARFKVEIPLQVGGHSSLSPTQRLPLPLRRARRQHRGGVRRGLQRRRVQLCSWVFCDPSCCSHCVQCGLPAHVSSPMRSYSTID